MLASSTVQYKIFAWTIFLSASIATFFSYQENLLWYTVFKPLTTLLIIAFSVIIYQKQKTKYTIYTSIGLLFALIGDILLIGENYFIFGLAAFLLAHILFTIAFLSVKKFFTKPIYLAILLSIGGAYYYFLYPHLEGYQIPVIIYLLTIVIMNWQALSLSRDQKQNNIQLLGVAALLFSFSDGVIAYDKFVEPLSYSSILILPTYWLAITIFTFIGSRIKDIK
jgi:uncharacterized membrane protein YhhN